MNDSEPELPETVELPTRAVHIGRDAEGCDHYVIPGQSVIVVRHTVDGDDHVITQQLEDRSLSEWVEYTDYAHGWTVCKYDDRDFAEWLLGGAAGQHGVSA